MRPGSCRASRRSSALAPFGHRGRSVCSASRRTEWLDQLATPGARVRAASLLVQLDLLLELRPKAKTAMIAEARKQPGWKPLRSIPFLGVVRVAQLLAIMADRKSVV